MAEQNGETEVKFDDLREALDAMPVGTVFEQRHRMVKAANGGWRSATTHAESHGYYVPASALTPPANTGADQ